MPEDDAVGSRNMDKGIDGNGEDPHTLDDDPVPEQSQPQHSTHVHQAPIPDDDPRYERSSYNKPSQVPDSVGVSWVMTAKHDIPQTFTNAMNRSDSDCWL